MNLSDPQRRVVESPLDQMMFLEGDAGTGKTTAAIERALYLLSQGVPAGELLVLVPQAVLALPYQRALRSANLPPGGQVEIITFGGLVTQTVKLFWPLAARRGGFVPDVPPTFLTLETAQYIMATVVDPLIERRGYFDGVTIDRNRLYAQIIDNLEKAALNDFPMSEIGERLKSAWMGDRAQARMFDHVQEAADEYRALCRAHNLLDFSLQVEVFTKTLWRLPQVRGYWLQRGAHLIADNIEESAPAAHQMIADWLVGCQSALIVLDSEAGFRRFLSASPESAERLRDQCQAVEVFTDSFVMAAPVAALGDALARGLEQYAPETGIDPAPAYAYELRRFYPQMLNWVADTITLLVKEEHVPPGEIVILAPYLSDALRFTLMQRLQGEGIPVRSHRPSRSLREEPAARCLLTLALLAHPEWGLQPSRFDIAYMFMQAIGSAGAGRTMDLIRAQLLADAAYPAADAKSRLLPFDQFKPEVQERITFLLAPRYEALRKWIESYIADREQARADALKAAASPAKKGRGRKKKTEPVDAETFILGDPFPIRLDHFFSRLFGEVLSQRGYGFHADFDAATVAGNLVDSAANFRRAFDGRGLLPESRSAAEEFVRMVDRGVIADQYVRAWQIDTTADAVLIAPAYTFLMRNQPVTYQFWLDLGNRGWFERLLQPLTHPYVLGWRWEAGRQWTDDDEFAARADTLFNLIMGLVRRCRTRIYFGLSELGESGAESTGELVQAFNRMLRRLNPPDLSPDAALALEEEDDDDQL
ncbi:MAG: hypothetical protein SF162_10435 [bacterium]|nr:hypothetical protein [bacterium]